MSCTDNTDNIIQYAMPYISEYMISDQDTSRPWGGFFYIDNKDQNKFIKEYFNGIEVDEELPISPKILVINSGKRLSWQYHNRRREIWVVLKGPVGVMTSKTDEETEIIIKEKGDIIIVDVEERHRIVGLDEYAVVAELWCHIDIGNPSNELDIIRIQDDFRR